VELSQARTIEEQEKWASDADAAQDKRMENVKAMDIYETKGLKCQFGKCISKHTN
jgi:hypothetical protein